MRAELAAALLVVMATPGILRCRPRDPGLQPAQVVEQVWQTVNQKFIGPNFKAGGIGLVDIWSPMNHTTGGFDILHLVAGSPACKAALRPQDLIEAVDGRPTRSLSQDEVLMRTRGPVGTEVRLKVLRGNQHFEVGMVRETLTSHTVHALVIDDDGWPIRNSRGQSSRA